MSISQYDNPYAIAFAILSAFSALCSFVIVLSGILFPSLMSRSRPISHIIVCVSMADMLGSIASTMGFPHEEGSTLCKIQGFMWTYFFPASWMWTTVLVYQLRNLLISKHVAEYFKRLHACVWGLALLPALLPQSTNTYGQDDTVLGYGTCTFGGQHYYKRVWLFTILFSLPIFCFLLMAGMLVEIKLYFRKISIQKNDREYTLYRATRVYALALLVTWIPLIVTSLLVHFNDVSPIALSISLCIASQYGTIVAVCFVVNSKRVRTHWLDLLCKGRNRSPDTQFADGGTNMLRNSMTEDGESHRASKSSREHSIESATAVAAMNTTPKLNPLHASESNSPAPGTMASYGERSRQYTNSGSMTRNTSAGDWDSDEELLYKKSCNTSVSCRSNRTDSDRWLHGRPSTQTVRTISTELTKSVTSNVCDEIEA